MKLVALLSFVGVAQFCAFAASQKVVDTDVVFDAPFICEDFSPDGVLDEEVWRKARAIDQVRNVYSKKALPYSADIRLAYSRTAVYVGAVLTQNMQTCVFKWDQHDLPIWNDDNLELFLFVPGDEANHLCQFVINPLGSVADLKDGNINWNASGMEVKAARFEDRWVLEMKIPFAAIGCERPAPGDFIGARFCRWIHDGEERYHGTEPLLLTSGNDQRSRFAKLNFCTPEGEGAEAIIAEAMAWKADSFRRRFMHRYNRFVKRFAEIEGCAAAFSSSSNVVHRKVVDEVVRMRKTLDGFQQSCGNKLASTDAFPAASAKEFLEASAKFERFASEHAYAVWQSDLWAVGNPNEQPPQDSALMPKTLRFEQAGNEREQICLNIHGLLCGGRLDLRLWPEKIEKKDKPFLSPDSIEVYLEPFVDIEGELVTMPLVQAHGNMVTVSPGRSVRVWIVFNSRKVNPGSYSTQLVFKPMYELQVPNRKIAVEATVWDFALPETHDWPLKSFFWGSFSFNNDEVSTLELMHDFHVTHGWTQFHRYRYGMHGETGYWTKPDCGRGKVVAERDFDERVALTGNQGFLERAKELGMRFVIGWSTPRSLDWFKIMTKRFRSMGFEWEDFVFKGLLRDEFVRRDIPECAMNRKAVEDWNTNLWFQATLLSTPPPTGASAKDIEKAALPNFYKQWTVIRGLCKDPERGEEILQLLRKNGCSIWSYQCAHFMHKQSILGYYRLYPWECRMQNLAGCALWTIYSPKGDGWDCRDGMDEGICWRGVDTKPVPTKQLHAFREGLEDVAYMAILERMLGDSNTSTEAGKYRKLLDERAGIVKRQDAAEVARWRLAIGRAINDICRKDAKK